ncbi:hypothetical protein PUMCH_001085 [Australozyma saopauloensis]|uniref:Peptidase M20 dimerisation domain-containing protein n=1 Tax=Australozyma saopauloensis TaxID=291208 RepID=A0AAX4H5P6_9ASCO|nr:hypothetical protein PUMCH_001085 [[Candida] saopauloensis]
MRGLPIDKPTNPSKRKLGTIAIAIAAIGSMALIMDLLLTGYLKMYFTNDKPEGVCPIWDIQRPKSFIENNGSVVREILFDEKFRNGSAAKLSGMVQIDTQMRDNPPTVEDDPEYWSRFKKLHLYLETTFPEVYETADVVKINTYGLVFTWKGSDEKLKPLMLAAHQDVVPVQKDTLSDWTYPPFEGHYDGEYVWGRGSSDCKNVLSAIFEALALLKKNKFKPTRTIVLAFGMDEEVSGRLGAGHIAPYLEKTFGKNSMYAIVDEGAGMSIEPSTQRIFALPGTREKGYLDISTELITPGGHSSIPPEHTSIGIMAELEKLIEGDPYKAVFTPENPTFEFLQCLAVHGGDKLSWRLRKSILRSGYDKIANSYVIKYLTSNRVTKYLVQTSQAMDIIRGGEKNNALPESVQLLTNHRVAIESTIQEVTDRFVSRVHAVAKKFDLGLKVNGETVLESTSNGHFSVKDAGHSLEVAPKTPIGDKVWKELAGATRHVYEDAVFTNLTEPIIVAPAIMTGNTDTRYYWNLTHNIFRYTPVLAGFTDSRIHSVDERMGIDNHLRLIAFFYEYVQIVDEA